MVASGTGMSKSQADRAIKKIVENRMLIVVEDSTGNSSPSYALTDLKELLVSGTVSLVGTQIESKQLPCVPGRDTSVPGRDTKPSPLMIKERRSKTLPLPPPPSASGRESASQSQTQQDFSLTPPTPKQLSRKDHIRAAVRQCQSAALGGKTIWPPAAEKCLVLLCRDYPESQWPAEVLVRCVATRFASEVDPAQPPQQWLSLLPSYVSGRKDRYGKPTTSQIPRIPAKIKQTEQAFQSAISRECDETGCLRLITHPAQIFHDIISREVSPQTYNTWFKHLKLAVHRKSNLIVLLAPSIDFDGLQVKYEKQIKKVLLDSGLKDVFELWTLSGEGWDRRVSSNAA